MADINRIERWFDSMEKLGQADIPMEIDGQIMTPRQYLQKVRGALNGVI